MDWLRRNWPDLLIGIALVAVIAGIIATLITGGSFFPVGQTTARTTPPPAQNAITTPGVTTPGAAPGAGVPTPDAAAVPTTPGPSAPGSTTPGSNTPRPDAAAPNNAADAAAAVPGISVLPPEGSSSAAVDDRPASTPSAPEGAAGAGAQAAVTTPSTPPSTTPTPSPSAGSGAFTAAADGPGDEAPYRVSVGAFGQRANAEAQAATFQAAGYPVFLAEQGNLNIVLVGPYATESEADAVAARIRAGGFGIDPVIYRFTGDTDSAPAADRPVAVSTPRTTTPGPAASAVAPAVAPASAPAASTSGRYIQVGAYGSPASAQPQNDRLASLGYRVTERTEGDLVKLLIGPFDSARLAEVQAELDAVGIESFAR